MAATSAASVSAVLTAGKALDMAMQAAAKTEENSGGSGGANEVKPDESDLLRSAAAAAAATMGQNPPEERRLPFSITNILNHHQQVQSEEDADDEDGEDDEDDDVKVEDEDEDEDEMAAAEKKVIVKKEEEFAAAMAAAAAAAAASSTASPAAASAAASLFAPGGIFSTAAMSGAGPTSAVEGATPPGAGLMDASGVIKVPAQRPQLGASFAPPSLAGATGAAPPVMPPPHLAAALAAAGNPLMAADYASWLCRPTIPATTGIPGYFPLPSNLLAARLGGKKVFVRWRQKGGGGFPSIGTGTNYVSRLFQRRSCGRSFGTALVAAIGGGDGGLSMWRRRRNKTNCSHDETKWKNNNFHSMQVGRLGPRSRPPASPHAS